MDTTSVKTSQNFELVTPTPDDAAELGRICYEAFKTISEAHGFPPDFPNVEAPTGLISMVVSHPDVYGVAARTHDGKLLGSNYLWEMDAVSGVGPITIDVAKQNAAVGRRLMEDVIRRSDERGHLSVRLVQAAFHARSLALYTKLGFNTVEPLSMPSMSAFPAARSGP